MYWTGENPNSVEIIIKGVYQLGEEEQVRLKVSGDGSLEYFVDTMKAALVAFGFAPQTVEKIKITDGGDEE